MIGRRRYVRCAFGCLGLCFIIVLATTWIEVGYTLRKTPLNIFTIDELQLRSSSNNDKNNDNNKNNYNNKNKNDNKTINNNINNNDNNNKVDNSDNDSKDENTNFKCNQSIKAPYQGPGYPHPLTVVNAGETIKVAERTEVHVLSAFRRGNNFGFKSPSGEVVALVTWAGNIKTRDKHKFVCCLTSSASDYVTGTAIQVPAKNIFSKFSANYTLGQVLDMHSLTFVCPLPGNHSFRDISAKDDVTKDLRYVAFAERSCDEGLTWQAHKIVEPENGTGKVAVCVGFIFGDVNLQQLVEWFEFAKVVGVSRVQVFYSTVTPAVMNVLRHYRNTGFLILAPSVPPFREDEPVRDYSKNEPRKWNDKQVLETDCMHRLSGYDYVMIQDLDELFVPYPPFSTVHEVLTDANEQHPNAAGFHAHTSLVLVDHWPQTDPSSPISFLTRLERTVSDNVDNKGWGKSSPKIIYRPDRIRHTATHAILNYVDKRYKTFNLSSNSYKFLHYRTCKPKLWKTCEFKKVRDETILKFLPKWLDALRHLPLKKLGVKQRYPSSDAKSYWSSDAAITPATKH